MRSKEKIEVTVGLLPQYGGKQWVKVKFKNDHQNIWVPSFEDLYRILKAIGYCEDEKYPFGRGRKMVSDFIYDVLNTNLSFEDLARKYDIPIRD